eukprot:6960643-Alexandrium_andersonii.AAC.1
MVWANLDIGHCPLHFTAKVRLIRDMVRQLLPAAQAWPRGGSLRGAKAIGAETSDLDKVADAIVTRLSDSLMRA